MGGRKEGKRGRKRGGAKEKRMERRGGANRQRAKCSAIKNGMQIH